MTLPYSPRLPGWPGEPKPVIERLADMTDGADANVMRIYAAVHFGAHVDASVHFIEGAAGIEALAVEIFIGPALVVDLPDADVITAEALATQNLPEGTERILFKTRNSDLWNDPDHEFYTNYVAIAADGARDPVGQGVKLVGVYYLSVEPFHNDSFRTHKTLLGAGVILAEGLDLHAVPSGTYEMACLPMKIVGADGVPARAVLWRDE